MSDATAYALAPATPSDFMEELRQEHNTIYKAVLPELTKLHGRAKFLAKQFPGNIRAVSDLITDPDEAWELGRAFSIECAQCKTGDSAGGAKVEILGADEAMSANTLLEMMDLQAYGSSTCQACKSLPRALGLERDMGEGEESAVTAVNWELIALRRELAGNDVVWLIPGVMERGKLAALFGPPKAGKSLLALEWAITATREGQRVLYLDKENDPAEVYARAADMGYQLGTDEELSYHSFMSWKADTEEGAAKIIEAVDDHSADLVIFDSWAKFITGTQSDDATANRAYELTIVPLRKKGIGVLRLDHSGHSDVHRPAGTIAKLADVDHNWQIKARQLDDKRAEITLVHRDNRTGRGEDTINLIREVGPLRHVPRGQVAIPPDEAASEDPIIALVELMDERGWPVDWSVRKTVTELKAIGQGTRAEVVTAAIRKRRESGVTVS